MLEWVHGSHLDVPLVTTNASGATATTPNDYLAPGFPGQSRTLADLYYNRYRDFEPTTGRYIQADPIGLDGGQNPYVYAANNPIRFTDPMGLQAAAAAAAGAEWGSAAWPWGAAAGAAGGAAAALCLASPTCRDALGDAARKVVDACSGRDDDKPCRTISGKVVPVGTIAYRPLDTPSQPQHGIVGPHYNLYRANKNPNNARCFWQSIGAVSPGNLPRGAIPIEPFAN